MSKATFSAVSLTGVLFLATAAGLPTLAYADDGYRSVTSVRVGSRDHGGYRDRDGYRDSHRNRGGYSHWDSHKHYKHRGHGHGHSARPHYPTTYIVVPRYRSYYEPRYYGGGRSGWDVDLHYYFRD